MLPVVTLTIAKYKNYFKKRSLIVARLVHQLISLPPTQPMSEVKGFSENPVNAIKKVALDCQIDAISVYLGVVTGSHQYFVF